MPKRAGSGSINPSLVPGGGEDAEGGAVPGGFPDTGLTQDTAGTTGLFSRVAVQRTHLSTHCRTKEFA